MGGNGDESNLTLRRRRSRCECREEGFFFSARLDVQWHHDRMSPNFAPWWIRETMDRRPVPSPPWFHAVHLDDVPCSDQVFQVFSVGGGISVNLVWPRLIICDCELKVFWLSTDIGTDFLFVLQPIFISCLHHDLKVLSVDVRSREFKNSLVLMTLTCLCVAQLTENTVVKQTW